MNKINVFLVITSAIFGIALGGCGGGTNLRTNMSSSHVNTMAQATESTEEKGCLSADIACSWDYHTSGPSHRGILTVFQH